MANKRITDLDAGSVNQHSWFEQADTENDKSEKVSADDIADYVGMSANFSSLDTTAKGLVGAVNEINTKTGKVLTAKLDAGVTSITISDASITADSMILPYFEPEVMYNSLTPSVGSVVLTFDAQEVDVNIKLEVK